MRTVVFTVDKYEGSGVFTIDNFEGSVAYNIKKKY